MNPADFPTSLDRLFKIVRRTGRTASGEGRYAEVEHGIAQPSLSEAIRYYKTNYAHNDAHGTEIIFTSNRGDFHVLRAQRPVPKVELIPVRVA